MCVVTYSLHESESVTIKYERNLLSQIHPAQDMSAQGALRADLAHHDSMDGSTVHRRDLYIAEPSSERSLSTNPRSHCLPAGNPNEYISIDHRIGHQLRHQNPPQNPPPKPFSAAQLWWPSTRRASSACFPRRGGGPQSVVPCPTHPNSIADTPAHAAHGWVHA